MNKVRRMRLEAVIEKLEELQSEISCIAEEEQDAYDNLPESIQLSDRGDVMSENVSSLEELDETFEELKDSINDIIG